MTTITRGLAAIALLSGPVSVSAQTTMTAAFVKEVGMSEVIPNFYITEQQVIELKNTHCTGGPKGLFNDLVADRKAKGFAWCNRDFTKKLSGYVKEGAHAYTLMITPVGFRLTIHDKAINLDRNVKCHADIPFSGVYNLNFTCFDSKSGKQVVSEIIGSVIGNTVPMATTAVLSNLTAPRAGSTNINVGSESTSGAKATSTGGGGAPVHIYNNPSATAGASVYFRDCPTTTTTCK